MTVESTHMQRKTERRTPDQAEHEALVEAWVNGRPDHLGGLRQAAAGNKGRSS